MDNSSCLVETRDIVKTYRRRNVVNGVNLTVNRGEIVGLLGPNGAGKTTSFYMIVGLIKPTQGRIFFKGQDVTRKPMYYRSRMGMGYLSQEPSIFRRLTVEENVMAILETLPISDARAAPAAGVPAGGAEDRLPGQAESVYPQRRRAAPAGNHAGACDQSVIDFAG